MSEEAKTTTLRLRDVLPQVKTNAELVIEDGHSSVADKFSMHALTGEDLLFQIKRSRVVDGEYILGLVPSIYVGETFARGSAAAACEAPRVQLRVQIPTGL